MAKALSGLILAAVVLAGPSALAGVTGVDTKPLAAAAKAPARPQWRMLSLPGGRELTFSDEAPGRLSLAFVCKPGEPRLQIRAPLGDTATAPAVRLSTGGFVRVYFARPEYLEGREGLVVATASPQDELLKSFKTTGRIMSGRTAMAAQTPAEKEAIKAFFTACTSESRAGL